MVGDSALRAYALEHELLALGPLDVGLVRGALVLADARELERLLPTQVMGASVEPEHVAVLEHVARHHAALQRHVDSAQRVDELREVVEAHLHHVVDLHAVAEEALDRLRRQARAPDRERGVDLLGPVARDLGIGVARYRQPAHAAERGVEQQDAVGAAGTGGARLVLARWPLI